MFMLNGNHESLNIAGNFRRAASITRASRDGAQTPSSMPASCRAHPTCCNI